MLKIFKTLSILVTVLAAISSVAAQTSSTSTTTSSIAAQRTGFVQQIGDTGGPPAAGVFREGSVKTFDWNIGWVENVTRFNSTRRMIGVNGKWPIDAIVVDYNDTLIFNVFNSLDEATSVHFHGLFQYGTPEMDGATFVTQCPIPVNSRYTYKFKALQWGTYWIHGHWKGEYVDGFRSALVINPPPSVEMAPFDIEATFSISDWYNQEHALVLSKFLSPYNPSGAEPVPDQGMLNESDNPSFRMTAGKIYKFRFISFAPLVAYDFYIEGHDMFVVEVDGVDVVPSLQSSFSLAPAQRLAIIVKAREAGNGTDINYNLHAVMESGMFDGIQDSLILDVTMPLIYNTASSAQMFPATNETIPDFKQIMDELTLTPVAPLDTLPAPHASNSFQLDVSFEVYSDGVNHGAFNNTPYMMSVVPPLYTTQTIGDELVNNPTVYGKNTVPMVVPNLDDIAEIIIVNTDSGKHPFHLHGHTFQLIALTNNSFDPANPYPNPLPSNPIRRDTVNIPGGGYAILRFKANNPGVWFLHCHIEWHFEAGLLAVLVEAPSKIGGKVDNDMAALCKAQGIPTAGNAAGNMQLDMSGYMVGPQQLPTTITASGWGAMAACAISSFIGVATVIWFARKEEVGEKGGDVPKN
ncbi:hypothetical protein HDU98_000905 [Podochytrium sp. JEL0797]|nr:hypothetical protein HDU98_000905 [Podochytrium sp. JEL0797]